ncbi:GntR family transcriptional regulator [Azohydromonas caseinilytica]|uniref:GntR family transcriptional regulator n=1 Tax=Azohydromonas caseinilytica TaxID=2728836 RepID=A0A848FG14_9BURK|nr:GntR family transcriptional regulator [Azohydromonas caseinilytica]NML17193.1 GntR family transcriptional regulator [Azohydromonas caseinilytica]
MPLDLNDVPNLGLPPTISDVIAKHLRNAIVTGQLHEGEPIRQDEVAAMFKVSKIPVREALKHLEAEGLVAFQRNRGAVVHSLSESEIVQIYEVRAMLESNAMRLSVPRMTPATLERAQRLCDEFAQEHDPFRWAELHWAFHSCLYQDAQRPFLMNLIQSINNRTERYLHIQLTRDGGRDTADTEHQALVDACRRDDADEAARLVHEHIMAACELLRRHLPQPDAQDGAAGKGGA